MHDEKVNQIRSIPSFGSTVMFLERVRRTNPGAEPLVLAQLASATIHTIAIRARARVPRKELEAIVTGAIDVMVGKK